MINRIAVFCGSSSGNNPIYKERASLLGKEIAAKGIGVVYGGGNKGLMGEIAHSVYNAGSEVIGVLPESMNIPSVTDNAVHTELIIVKNMHERKQKMYSLSDGFIAMPGGIGTIEELSEIYTWRQLGYHKCNIALYNINGFWDLFIKQLEHATSEGFISKEVLDTLIVESNPTLLLEKLEKKPEELPSKI